MFRLQIQNSIVKTLTEFQHHGRVYGAKVPTFIISAVVAEPALTAQPTRPSQRIVSL